MQKIFYTIVAVAALTACKSNDKSIDADAPKMVTVSNTAEMQEFMDWKAEKLAKEKAAATYTVPVAPVRTKVIYKKVPVYTKAPASVPAEPAKKKGWSKAAKGAVIGAGAGAAAGAIIVKNNRALCAAIGGVLGGGVGYGIGRGMDKKDGRY
jgi:Glycine zipper/Prokaryotic membrane lipoprotein lipid attachment site